MLNLKDEGRFAGIRLSLAITVCFWVVIAVILVILCGGCATPMYRAPCEHKVPMDEVKKIEGVVNYCPICKNPYPYIPVSRHGNDDDDDAPWYSGLGWHWTGPYGYGRPYPYYGSFYGGGYYRHNYGCDCDHCR